MQKEFTPEIGQALFGQPFMELDCPKEVERGLWMIANYMDVLEMDNPFYNTGATFKNDTFEANAYSWDEDNEQEYNFKWKDFKVSWYKYLGRGMSASRGIGKKELRKMLTECIKSLETI